MFSRVPITVILGCTLLAAVNNGCTSDGTHIDVETEKTQDNFHSINSSLLHHEHGELNLKTYDQVCNTVFQKFFDPEFNGIDWNALCSQNRSRAEERQSRSDTASMLNEMLSSLKTSHTAFYTPDEKNYYLLFDVFGKNPNLDDHRRRLFNNNDVSFEGIGIFTIVKNNTIFISDIVEGSSAAKAGLEVGDEVVAVDDQPFHPIKSFRNKNGTISKLNIRRSLNGPTQNIAVTVEQLFPSKLFQNGMRSSARLIEQEGKKVGYVHIWSSAGTEYEEILQELLQSGPLSESEVLIIDMRGKIGGGGLNYLKILDPYRIKITVKGRGFSVDQEASLKDKLVWIIDDGVRSSAELLAYEIKTQNYGPMIGERTAGAVTGGSPSITADDSLLYVAVADLWVDGTRLEGNGVQPDIAVPFSIPYSSGKDPQFDRALEEAIKLVSP